MKKLLSYLNSLSESNRCQFCNSCGTSEGYLRKAVSVRQSIGPILCVAIEKYSNGKVTRKDLRPNDWHLIWPELRANHQLQAEPA